MKITKTADHLINLPNWSIKRGNGAFRLYSNRQVMCSNGRDCKEHSYSRAHRACFGDIINGVPVRVLIKQKSGHWIVILDNDRQYQMCSDNNYKAASEYTRCRTFRMDAFLMMAGSNKKQFTTAIDGFVCPVIVFGKKIKNPLVIGDKIVNIQKIPDLL